MQKSGALMTSFLILCGCTHDQYPDLKKLATGLEQPWPGAYPLSMTMTLREAGGHTVLHCRLQNPSSAALALDRSRLPWKQPIYFTGTVVTSAGRTFAIGPVSILAYIVAEPDPFLFGPNEVLEGDFELKYLPKNPRVGPPPPKDEDTLFMWSYNLPSYGETLPQEPSRHDHRQRPTHTVSLVGVTFLPRQAMELL